MIDYYTDETINNVIDNESINEELPEDEYSFENNAEKYEYNY